MKLYHPASGSNSPSLVIGFCIVVVWTTPTRSYGKITGYDVRFIPQGSGSDLVVSKGRRELFHAVGDTGIVTDNVMVQVYYPLYIKIYGSKPTRWGERPRGRGRLTFASNSRVVAAGCYIETN